MAKKKTVHNDATSDLASPQTRTEKFLAKIGGLADTLPEGEYSRLERYLKYIAENGGGGSGVSSFNTRTGAVMPASGDYDANMVGAPEASSLAPEFSASGTYAVGDFVMQEGALYICSAPHSTSAWDASHFTAVNAGTYLKMVAANQNANGFAAVGYQDGINGKQINVSSVNETITQFTAKLDDVITSMQNYTSILIDCAAPSSVTGTTRVGVARIFRGASQEYACVEFIASHAQIRWIMYKDYGDWQPIEYVNPPLIADTEYRTTERFEGKPVYVQLLNLGTAANDWTVVGTNYYSHSIPITNFGKAISTRLYTTTGLIAPLGPFWNFADSSATSYLYLSRSDYGSFGACVAPNLSTLTLYVLIKYTKV